MILVPPWLFIWIQPKRREQMYLQLEYSIRLTDAATTATTVNTANTANTVITADTAKTEDETNTANTANILRCILK